jgi:hypothetical protein
MKIDLTELKRKYWFEERLGWLKTHNGLFTVTHWMPLPEQPEEVAHEEG